VCDLGPADSGRSALAPRSGSRDGDAVIAFAAPTRPSAPDQLDRLRAAMVAPSGRVVLVNVPMGTFLMVDGSEMADEDELADAVRALTDLSAAVRLYLQAGADDLLDPMPLEILWSPPGESDWRDAMPGDWSWTAMVGQPAGVTPVLLTAVRDARLGTAERLDEQVRTAMRRARLGSLREGLCAQTAYAGRAARSAQVADRLLDHIRAMGYEPHGPHHEIHVADLRHPGVAPLRTVVRQPIRHG
jgi:hypothetical protein